jgi:RHS repeat-associated protein
MLGNRPLVVYNSGATWFHHVNNIDSRTFMTSESGSPTQDMVFYPWGGAWNTSGGGGLEFAGLAYDDPSTNSQLTTFRLFSGNLGRWFTPDPLGGDVTNPQSLNRYAYVLNNPMTLTDPTGLVTIHGPGNPPGGGGGGCDPGDPSCDPEPSCDIDFVFCGPGNGDGGVGDGSGGTAGRGTPGLPNAFLGSDAGVLDLDLTISTITWACAYNPMCLVIGGAGVAGAAYQIGTMYVSAKIGQAIVKAGVQIYQSRAEDRLIRDIARRYCVDRRALGKLIHEVKGPIGGGTKGFDLTKEEIEALAETLPKLPGCTPQQ